MGAPEIVLGACPPDPAVRSRVDTLSDAGQRVLLVAHAEAPLEGETLPAGLAAVAVLTFEEQVRPDAAETMRYFESQGVGLKVISGDNPRTVGAVAERVGVPDVGTPVDARSLPDDPAELAPRSTSRRSSAVSPRTRSGPSSTPSSSAPTSSP